MESTTSSQAGRPSLQDAPRPGNQGRADSRLPLVVLERGGRIMRTFATFAALAATALVIVSTAVAGRPDIVVLPPVELDGLSQHDCGDYELLLSGTMERHVRYTLNDAGEDIAEHRQVRIIGTIWNSVEPAQLGAVPPLDPDRLGLRNGGAGDHRHDARGAARRGERPPRERDPRRGLDGRRFRGRLPDAPLPGWALRQPRPRRLGPPLRGAPLAALRGRDGRRRLSRPLRTRPVGTGRVARCGSDSERCRPRRSWT